MRYALVLVAGCGSLQGFGGDVPPLATIHVSVNDVAEPHPDRRVALVWGMQWLPEAFCILPSETTDADAMKARGCRDPFGFVPFRVEADAPVDAATGDATIELLTVPAADVLVGDVTARVAYGSLVLYDDVDGNGTLNIVRPDRLRGPMMGPPDPIPTMQHDVVVTASFVTMTLGDQRLAYREGAFVPSAFYPRSGCGDPPPAFSILAASGMGDPMTALLEAAAGMIPPEIDPATCAETAPPEAATIQLDASAQAPTGFPELACTERSADSSVRYLEPDVDMPDVTDRVAACVHVPSFGGPSDQIELLLSSKSTDACMAINHFILKGCREGPDCGTPDWDHSLAPPSWWPCPH